MWGAQQRNGLWYDRGGASNGTDGGGNRGTTTDAKFIKDWEVVARHFAGNPTIIGYDLRNEPLDLPGMSVWGGGSDRDIRSMYLRAGNAILAVDPNKLIIVEPPNGDCRGVRSDPLTLSVPGKLVYSVHEYPGEISGQKVDSGPELIKRMDEFWGWIVNENLAPVFIGEMGASMASPGSRAWAATVVPYFNGTGTGGLKIGEGGQGLRPIGGPGAIWRDKIRTARWIPTGRPRGRSKRRCMRSFGKSRLGSRGIPEAAEIGTREPAGPPDGGCFHVMIRRPARTGAHEVPAQH